MAGHIGVKSTDRMGGAGAHNHCPAVLQQSLPLEKRGPGGAQPGAGRKRNPKQHDTDHKRRPDISTDTPFHVVLRTRADVPRLRQQKIHLAIRHALAHVIDRGFRVVHTSIQRNHLHFIVDADHRDILIRGMQSLAIVAARAINRAAARRGKVFAYRYHATRITLPKQMRHTLAYVLNNWRRHHEDRGESAKIDRYSTAIWFGAWRDIGRFRWPSSTYIPLPAANAVAWLLTTGWRRHGLLDPAEVPGPS